MGPNSDGFSVLTARHGCKCITDDSVSVEDCLIAVGNEIGAQNILSASRMNKAFVVFLKELTMVDHLVECGVSVRDNFIPVLPLSNLSKKVILSNVPPFIPNDMLERILVRYGKIVGSMKMIPLGIKNPNLKHIMSFRRHIFMILSAEYQDLNVAVKLTVLGKDYTIFITSDTMRCFVCGKHGHTRQTCPTKKDAEQVNHGDESVTADAQVNLTPGENNENETDHQHPEKVTDGLGDPSSSGCVENSDVVPIVTDVLTENVAGDRVEKQDGTEPTVVDSAGVSEQHCGEQVEFEGAMDLMDSQIPDKLLNDSRDGVENDGLSLYDSDSEGSDSGGDSIDATSQGSSTSKTNVPCYTVEQLNHFLDSTKNQKRPKIEMYFSNLRLFNESCALAMKKATLEELDQPKRYRLKKFMCNVRKRMKTRSVKH